MVTHYCSGRPMENYSGVDTGDCACIMGHVTSPYLQYLHRSNCLRIPICSEIPRHCECGRAQYFCTAISKPVPGGNVLFPRRTMCDVIAASVTNNPASQIPKSLSRVRMASHRRATTISCHLGGGARLQLQHFHDPRPALRFVIWLAISRGGYALQSLTPRGKMPSAS